MTVLYEAVVGSKCYGTAVEGSDDDILRVVLDRPEAVLAIDSEIGERGHHVLGDEDSQTYSLRRFASLVAKGNPSIISALCSPWYSGLQAVAIRKLITAVHCQQTIQQFVGMTLAQIKRFRAGHLAEGRRELIEKYGYDTKFIYHIERLKEELEQFLVTGTVRYPLDIASVLVDIRGGKYTRDEVESLLLKTEAALRMDEQVAKERLTPQPDRALINDIVLGIYEDSWGLPGGTFRNRSRVLNTPLAS